MKEKFKDIKFSADKLAMIERANAIIKELRDEGYTLTLRQLYYQLVSRDIIANKLQEYKKLGDYLNDARLAGLTDWSAIEDRTRQLEGVITRKNPAEILDAAASSYRIDKWDDQTWRVEVWVEKDALEGVLAKACWPLQVDWFSCRGYTSQTSLYDAGKRLAFYKRRGRRPVIIHLGDHDPSGIDMTRDIKERVSMLGGVNVMVKRIALNMDQIDEFSPPPNPAKITDSRFAGYQAEYGDESWELDALAPSAIDKLITDAVLEFRDEEKWEAKTEQENEERKNLAKAAKLWPSVEEFLASQDDPEADEEDEE